MNNVVKKYIINSDRKLKETSIKKYKNSVKKLYIALGLAESLNILIRLKNHKDTIQKIKNATMQSFLLNIECVKYEQICESEVFIIIISSLFTSTSTPTYSPSHF